MARLISRHEQRQTVVVEVDDRNPSASADDEIPSWKVSTMVRANGLDVTGCERFIARPYRPVSGALLILSLIERSGAPGAG